MSERGYAFATSLLGRPVDTSRITSLRAVPAPAEAGFFDLSRKRLSKASRGEVAPAAVVDAVEVAASGIGFEAGLAKEMQIFGQLAAGGQASAMQHVFSAERMISKIKGLPKDARAATVKEVAVIGSGTMGGGIAMYDRALQCRTGLWGGGGDRRFSRAATAARLLSRALAPYPVRPTAPFSAAHAPCQERLPRAVRLAHLQVLCAGGL